MSRNVPRRDELFDLGRDASALGYFQMLYAWKHLSEQLMNLGEVDTPKYRHVVQAIAHAIEHGKKHKP